MKNKILLPLFGIVAMSLTSCGGNKYTQLYKNLTNKAAFLHEIEFDNYRFDSNLETIVVKGPAGCSSVRNGDFVGRNFDFFYNDVPTFVTRVNKTADHFASISISQHFQLSENKLLAGEYSAETLDLLPNCTLDGINENGVYINDNVVVIEEDGKTIETNPGKPKVHMLLIPRYVLDHATSAEQAVSMLKNDISIYGDCAGKAYLHYMICDASNTYIVEIFNNQIISNKKEGNAQIMTNFYHNLGYINEHGMGVERYKILEANYDEGFTKEGMFTLMKRVQFSNAYVKANNWYSDMNYPQSILSQTPEGQDPTEWDRVMNEQTQLWNDVYLAGDRTKGSAAPWITVHNSVYDLKNKTLQVVVQEDYEHKYNFSL